MILLHGLLTSQPGSSSVRSHHWRPTPTMTTTSHLGSLSVRSRHPTPTTTTTSLGGSSSVCSHYWQPTPTTTMTTSHLGSSSVRSRHPTPTTTTTSHLVGSLCVRFRRPAHTHNNDDEPRWLVACLFKFFELLFTTNELVHSS
jgi:hypothetical protein